MKKIRREFKLWKWVKVREEEKGFDYVENSLKNWSWMYKVNGLTKEETCYVIDDDVCVDVVVDVPFMFEGKELKVSDDLYNVKNGVYYRITDLGEEWVTYLMDIKPIDNNTKAVCQRRYKEFNTNFTRMLPVTTKEMTVKEIEEALGYGVKITK